MIVTRFAPSPTGELHVGGARTALFAFLFARHNGGKFLLRIEDTDRERYIPESVGHIIAALNWLGLVPDNNDKVVIQSERLEIYKKAANELLNNGHAYICVCSKEKLTADRERQIAEKKPPRYKGHCRELNLKKNDVADEEFVIRMKVPKGGSIAVNDLIHGEIIFDLSLFDDQILIKSDGYPTYHLASVVDDHEMSVTHVIRAEEWLPSTPKHMLLYKMFDWNIPAFAHLPMNLAPDRSKLSKRHGATGVFEYKNLGYLPEALINFIALLGWHPSDDREIFSLSELIKEFSLERVQKSGAIFNIQKLDWLNGEYIKNMSTKDLYGALIDFYKNKPEIISDKNNALKLLEVGRSRMQKLTDFQTLKDSFDIHEYDKNLLIWKESSAEKTLTNLKLTQELLRSLLINEFSQKELEAEIMPLANTNGRGEILWPLRVALSGKNKSPGPFEIMSFIGKEETLRRIEMAIQKLES
ncbi:MAG: glutamate--tRNA ligase [Candidatus Harrisonbacteria bacterium]|nr:glutamate--tRNA ligase [Candidatus Harrisonbacteria bacterium]